MAAAQKPCEVNLYAPTEIHYHRNQSLQGALGIPEFMPPIHRWTFKVKYPAKHFWDRFCRIFLKICFTGKRL